MLNPIFWRRSPTPLARGMAALTVVMVLFFVMALVAAYTNRNLIFEQRISLGNYRSSRAAEAAEASVNWALSLLNGGRLNSQCLPSVDPNDLEFRLMSTAVPGPAAYAPEGSYATPADFNTANERVWGCVIADGAASCACPTTSAPNPTIPRPADGRGSAFHVSVYVPEGTTPRAGTLGLLGFACGSLGDGNNDCARSAGGNVRPQADGVSGVSQVVGLLRALPLAPVATLTVGGAVNAAAGRLRVSIPTSPGVYVMQSGQAYTPGPNDEFVLPAGTVVLPGTPPWRDNIVALNGLATLADDGWFRNLFAMDRENYRLQPAAQEIDCSAGCTEANLTPRLLGFPRSPIIMRGDVSIGTPVVLGSATEPVMLVIYGDLSINANATITGFVHANNVTWNANATLSGAMMMPGNFSITGGIATMSFNKPAIDLIKYRYGSFVRVPGSWNVREFYR